MAAPAPRPGILDIAPYIGGESSAPGVNRLIRLASNEGAHGPSPHAVAAYTRDAEAIHRYPDGGATRLRTALGRKWGLDAQRIVVGCGSDELIGLLCRAYAGPGDEVLHSAHGFLMYPIAAHTVGATPMAAPEHDLTTDVDAILAQVTDRTRIVFLANPNNPTGSYLPAAEMARLHAGLPGDVLLVIDAAYAEYVDRPDYEPGIALVEAHDNVVMTRTFSKIYALGGLRLGWAYCPAAIADVLNRVRGPFNVGAPALAAGLAALEDHDFVAMSQRHNDTWRAWFSAQVTALGLRAYPSVTNFVLIGFPGSGDAPDRGARAAEAARQFLKRHGILVRQMGAYGLADCLRVTIGREDEMRAVVEVLGRFLAEPS
ncbi:MAG: histidinol-phosphate transaminase [Azospirillaceae bacterium]|nr:histidinol-phosphate transaminase [Azospirillaceae bacterium]